MTTLLGLCVVVAPGMHCLRKYQSFHCAGFESIASWTHVELGDFEGCYAGLWRADGGWWTAQRRNGQSFRLREGIECYCRRCVVLSMLWEPSNISMLFNLCSEKVLESFAVYVICRSRQFGACSTWVAASPVCKAQTRCPIAIYQDKMMEYCV